MNAIRRANLDAFWSRSRGTVYSNANWFKKTLSLSSQFGLRKPFPPVCAMPVEDITGHGVAVVELMASLQPGKYHEDHCQFDTVRKIRSTYSNVWGASRHGTLENITTLSGDDKNRHTFTRCPTNTDWFAKFSNGMRKRMGQDTRPQFGISIQVMIELARRLEYEWLNSSPPPRDDILGACTYAHLCYCGSLRGNEGFQLDLGGLRSFIERGKFDSVHPHVVAPLLGRFKGEDGERYHLILLSSVTQSGLQPRKWLERLVSRRREQGKASGPAFSDINGDVVSSSVYENIILETLKSIQDSRPDLIGPELDVFESYGISRSFRRGATTQAQEQGVPLDAIKGSSDNVRHLLP